MSNTATARQALTLQADLKTQIESFFESLPELNRLVAQGTALVEQSKAITVFRRDQTGKIAVADSAAFLKATEQVQALKSVVEQMEEVYEPFAAGLFKAHRTVTGLRAGNVLDLTPKSSGSNWSVSSTPPKRTARPVQRLRPRQRKRVRLRRPA